MPIQSHRVYAFRVNFPHGPAILAHNNIDAQTDDERRKVLREIRKVVASNPDAKLDENSIVKLNSYDEVAGLVEDLRKELGDKPDALQLQTDMGLDTPNRLLTNPEISRSLAGETGPG